jgi:arylsulfatase A-like enzyme
MSKRKIALTAMAGTGLVLVGIAAALHIFSSSDSRPRGTIEDVLAFGDRDDTNVLFILVDTLRADRLSAYGYERDTSPALVGLAETGIRFTRHVAQSSWTKCSMASLWTGLYPARTGVLRSQHVIPPEARMPAEIFREAGYRTAGIWRNNWIAPNFGFAQGFEIYQSPKPTPLQRAVRRENPNLTLAGSDADIIRSASAFLRIHGHERWFLYLHLMDVHQYVSSEDEAMFGTAYSDLYDNSIRWVDRLVGHLVSELDRRGLRERTLIVFAADHGEAFGEHGGEGHARNVYGEVTETPFVLNLPFRLDPGILVEARSENVDLWPTVLDLLGLPALPDADGRSFVPEIIAAARGERGSDREEIAFAHLDETWGNSTRNPQPVVAVNQGRWRLIYPTARPRQAAIYDKTQDPREQRNLYDESTAVAEELVSLAGEYLETRPPWGDETPSIELDEMLLDQLRALGYGVQ